MKLIIINGPNLNLLGKREPKIYGSQTFDQYFRELQLRFKNVELAYYQSNIEGELIDKLHEVGFDFDGIVVEVHISNVHAREYFRHKSFISPNAKGVIFGFGLKGYDLAIHSFL